MPSPSRGSPDTPTVCRCRCCCGRWPPCGAYTLAARYWRTDRREHLTHQRDTTERREEYAHVERVETLRSTTQIEVARSGAAYAEALAQALVTRATLPDFDPRALESAGLPALPAADTRDGTV